MLGDKYSLLIEEIQNLISALEEKIKDKKTVKEKFDEDYDRSGEQVEIIEREIEEKKEDLSCLKLFENKNFFITATKEIAKSMAASFKESALFERIMFFMLLLVLTPLMWVVFKTTPFILAIGSLFYSLIILYYYLEIKKLRKIKSVADREKEITDLEKELAELKARMSEIVIKGNNINEEISKLYIKVAECKKNLKQAQKSRESIMEKLVSKMDLNSAFNLDVTGEILKRIREIRKEGLI